MKNLSLVVILIFSLISGVLIHGSYSCWVEKDYLFTLIYFISIITVFLVRIYIFKDAQKDYKISRRIKITIFLLTSVMIVLGYFSWDLILMLF